LCLVLLLFFFIFLLSPLRAAALKFLINRMASPCLALWSPRRRLVDSNAWLATSRLTALKTMHESTNIKRFKAKRGCSEQQFGFRQAYHMKFIYDNYTKFREAAILQQLVYQRVCLLYGTYSNCSIFRKWTSPLVPVEATDMPTQWLKKLFKMFSL
jgi:hypothetical protein